MELQRSHVQDALLNCNGNSKETWHQLKNLWPTKHKINEIMSLEGHTDPVDIVHTITTHFSTVGKCLSSRRNERVDCVNHDINGFCLSETDSDEVREMIYGLNASKACGIDGVTVRISKDANVGLYTVLAHIFNVSMPTSVFPTMWKTAVVGPLYKDGSRDCSNNYRPISLLPLCSKLLEWLVHDRIYSHLRRTHYFTDTQ